MTSTVLPDILHKHSCKLTEFRGRLQLSIIETLCALLSMVATIIKTTVFVLLLFSAVQCKYKEERTKRKELHNELIVSIF